MDLALLFVYILLIPFILMNIMISATGFLFSTAGKLIAKLLKPQIPKNEKRGYEILFTIAWLLAGIYALKRLENTNMLLAALTFLTFRNGATITKRFIYGIHDAKIVKESTKDRKLTGLVSKAVVLGILAEVLFLFIWALSYKAITAGVTTLLRVELNRLVLYLWVAGAVFGAAFGAFISHNNRGILLQNELALMLLFTGKRSPEVSVKLKNKAGKKTKHIFQQLRR